MKKTIRWSAETLAQLEEIHFYISQESIPLASRYTEKIIKAIERLTTFPHIGHIASGFSHYRPSLREFLVEEYRIIYQVNEKEIVLITLLHQKRLPRMSFGPFS